VRVIARVVTAGSIIRIVIVITTVVGRVGGIIRCRVSARSIVGGGRLLRRRGRRSGGSLRRCRRRSGSGSGSSRRRRLVCFFPLRLGRLLAYFLSAVQQSGDDGRRNSHLTKPDDFLGAGMVGHRGTLDKGENDRFIDSGLGQLDNFIQTTGEPRGFDLSWLGALCFCALDWWLGRRRVLALI